MTTSNDFRSGYVAIVGRPNVGKSTLLNALVGEKVSIVSAKPHTTRHQILGILNRETDQAVFMDTPGLQKTFKRDRKRVLHRLMVKTINQTVADADVILMLIEAGKLTGEDRSLANFLKDRANDTLLVLNKIDMVDSRTALLPILESMSVELPLSAFVPISARKGINLEGLVKEIAGRLPQGPALFPPGMLTDRSNYFRIAEIIREKLFSAVHQEVPYGLTVEVEYLGMSEENQWLIHAVIWVERVSQKSIVIGKGGKVLKAVGQVARRELIEFLNDRVHLELWVKVRERWSDSERDLKKLGFDLP
ncbi:MAG: GTPase Era [Pseudomonadota bacterium]|nr:GTPase Era [Pseudomonadota bacterium]